MKFPFAAMVLILLSGVCLIIFIVANYAFDNPDSGLFYKLSDSAGQTMNAGRQVWFATLLTRVRYGFGLCALILFTLGIVVAIAQSFHSTKIE